MMVVSYLLAIATLENKTASGYLDSTDEEVNKVHLDLRNEKYLVGLGTDGPPFMSGAVSVCQQK
jgi:hypothetical protein